MLLMLVALAYAAILCGCAGANASLSASPQSDGASSQRSADELVNQDAQAQDANEPSEAGHPFSARTRTWAVLGDSLTAEGFKATKKYYDYVAEDLGCTVINYGVKGTGYMTPEAGDTFYNRVDSMDLTNVDCVTIFGSFNDLGKGYYLGSAYDETTDSIGGCMNITVEKLVAKNPSLKIGIVTPTPWRTNFSYTSDGKASFDTITRSDCDAYVALLKDVAKMHRLPVLDLYETYGLDPDDETVRDLYYVYNEKMDEGGVHPNKEGHRFMYPQWREFVKTLLPSDVVE